MLKVYNTDFGTTFTNIPVKFSAEAPIPEDVYVERVSNCGFGGKLFKPRYLKAVFETGIYKYILGSLTNLFSVRDKLITAGATCIDLVGESWSNVPDTQLDPSPTYLTTPYPAADITGEGDREVGKFDYVSDALNDQRIGYSVESTNGTLLIAQKEGLTNAVVGGLNSRPRNLLITPRRLILHAEVDDETSIARNVLVSEINNLSTVANAISSRAFYFSYKGESARKLETIENTPAPTP